MSYLMQARDSVSGDLVTWTSATPDFAGASYPGGGSPQNIAIAAKGPGSDAGAADSANVTLLYPIRTSNPDGVALGHFLVYSSAYGRYRPAVAANITNDPKLDSMVTDALPVVVDGITYVRASPVGTWGTVITGLGAGTALPARLNTTTGKAERVTQTLPGDYPLGQIATDGAISLDIGGKISGLGNRILSGYSFGLRTTNTAAQNDTAIARMLAAAKYGDTCLLEYSPTGYRLTTIDLRNNPGVRILGGESPCLGFAGTELMFANALLSGSAASIASVSGDGSVDGWYTQTWTGLTGMSAALVGELIVLGNAATPGNNTLGVITAYISASSVKVASFSSAATDANNGALTWEVQNYGIRADQREFLIQGFFCSIADSLGYLHGVISYSESPRAGMNATTAGCLKDILMFPNHVGANTKMVDGIVLGNPFLPDTDRAGHRVDAFSNRIPRTPANCDFLATDNVFATYLKRSFMYTTNPGGQIRGLCIRRCGALGQPFGILTESASPTRPRGTFGFVIDGSFSAGGITDTIFKGAQNSMWALNDLHIELAKRLLWLPDLGGFDLEVSIRDPYINIAVGAGPTDAASPWVIVNQSTVNIHGGLFCPSNPSGSLWSPFKVVSAVGRINLFGCRVPDTAETGAPTRDPASTPGGNVNLYGCRSYNSGGIITSLNDSSLGTTKPGGDMLYAPVHSAGISSHTNGVPLRNHAFRAMVAGTDRTASITLPIEEDDADYSALITIDSASSSPAAGALKWTYFVTKKKIHIALSAAPGASQWVVLNVQLLRHGRGALTYETSYGAGTYPGIGGWTPASYSGSKIWIRADRGVQSSVFRITQQISGIVNAGDNFEQPTLASAPVVTDALSGSAFATSLNFAGGKTLASACSLIGTATNARLLIVGKPGANGDAIPIDDDTRIPLVGRNASGKAYLADNYSGGATVATAVDWNVPLMVLAKFNGASNADICVDSFTATASGAIATIAPIKRIYAQPVLSAGGWTGHIDEILLFTGDPAGQELQNFKDYYTLVHGRTIT